MTTRIKYPVRIPRRKKKLSTKTHHKVFKAPLISKQETISLTPSEAKNKRVEEKKPAKQNDKKSSVELMAKAFFEVASRTDSNKPEPTTGWMVKRIEQAFEQRLKILTSECDKAKAWARVVSEEHGKSLKKVKNLEHQVCVNGRRPWPFP